MTTSVKVTSHNYPARVEVVDGDTVTQTHIITPERGTVEFHCTTTRTLRIVDLEYDDPAVQAAKPVGA